MPLPLADFLASPDEILARIAETGKPMQLKHKGRTFTLSPSKRFSRLSTLVKRDIYDGDIDDIININWGKY